ncbi:MAG: YerC/YecD family TrpR-related protein [Acidimicrobiales bacterium]
MTTGKVIPADQHPETTNRFRDLVTAFAAVGDETSMAAFLKDLCTTNELDAMGQRLQVARLVAGGVPYQEISRRTGASTTTVTRVAHWLNYGEGGYQVVLGTSRS